jgi:hypothetical protein
MNEYVRVSVNSRVDFFNKYYVVPQQLVPEVQSFVAEINALGERCADCTEFEARFASSGLSDRFNLLLARCTPKPYQMTAEEKNFAKETAKQMFKENRSEIIKHEISEVADHVMVEVEEELIAQGRKTMIEHDVYDEYTRASNVLDNVKETGGWFKNHFRKKK